MSKGTHRVIVAGVGSMGAATCYQLARRGVEVIGLEQFAIPHRLGSHHGRTRMIRQSYYEHPDYVPILKRAYELWEELEAESGKRLLHLTGGLYLGPPDGEIVPGALASAREHGLPHSLLGADEVRTQFPAFRPPEGFVGFFEEQAGFLLSEQAVEVHAELARRHGAELHTGCPLVDWETTGDGVCVRTAERSWEADHLVVTAGAWAGVLLNRLGIPLEVTRQVLAWFEPAGDCAPFGLGEFPCWFLETDTPFGHYGFPVLPGERGLKLALHKPAQAVDPASLGGLRPHPEEEELDGLQAVLRKHIPGGAGPLHHACTCLYTNSPDHHFIVGLHPEVENVTVAAGFSGHGFKFASVMGEILADLATEGASGLPLAFLSPQRFAG